MADRDYLADLRTVAMNGVAEIAQRFKKPDADFVPAFMYVDGAGGAGVARLREEAQDEEEAERVKAVNARLIESILRSERALAAALVLSVWMAKAPAEFVQAAAGKTPDEIEKMAGAYKASRMPDRKEVLWLQVTDGQRYELWIADLTRHENAPPTVGEWRAQEHPEESVGRFMLLRIFKRARGMP